MALFGALTSVANKVKKALGIGQKPTTVIPQTRGQAFYRTYAGGIEANLTDAIQRKQPVMIYYDDKWQPDGTPGKVGPRIGNPHAIWIGSNGTKYLHMYVDPQSASATGDLPGWRTSIEGARRVEDLPTQARAFVDLVKREVGVPVRYVGVGADRDAVVERP